MTDPRNVHLIATKHILRYLRGTVDYGLKYKNDERINLEGYVDSDWAGSAVDRKSTLGFCFSMGSGVISWFSRKQSCMALSTAEVEYVTSCSASCEAVWLKKILSNLFDLQLDATCIHYDNQSCMKLSENLVFHDKSKHIEIKYHYIRDMVHRGVVKLQYVAMEEHIADVLMKPLARMKFECFKERLGVLQIEASFQEKVMRPIAILTW